MLASDLKTRFSNFKKDIADVTDIVLLNWIDDLNTFTHNLIAGIDAERLISQINFTVTHDDQQLALPADFQSIRHWQTGLYKNSTGKLGYITQTGDFTAALTLTGGTSAATAVIDADTDDGTAGLLTVSSVTGTFTVGETITDSSTGSAIMSVDRTLTLDKLDPTQPGSNKPGFYITGTVAVVTGITTNTVLTLRYVPQATDIDGTGDTLVIPDEYMDYAVRALDARYAMWDEDPGAESLADFRYVRALDELARNIKKEPASYGLSDYSSIY